MNAAEHFAKAEKHATQVEALVDHLNEASNDGVRVEVHVMEHIRAVATLTVARGQLHAALADIALRMEAQQP